MNRIITHTPALLLFVLYSLTAGASPFFVVIGSFTEQGDARRLVQSVHTQYEDVAFTYDAQRKLYHVYVAQTDSHAKAESLRSSVRLRDGFINAWIYTDLPSFGHAREIRKSTPGQYARLSYARAASASASPGSPLPAAPRSPAGKVTFAFRAKTAAGVNVPGKITLLNRDGNAVAAFKTGNTVTLDRQGGQKLILSCEVAGYGPELAFIDLANISASENIRVRDDGTLEVTFALGKIEPNTVRLVYRDMFHKDASVFREGTKERLELVSGIIKRNPYLHVEIDAHCGDAGRRVLRLATDDDYFDVSRAVARTGNERALTLQRARTVRNYLIAQGTHGDISAMGWGDLAPLLSPDTADKTLLKEASALNERVEVELKTLSRVN